MCACAYVCCVCLRRRLIKAFFVDISSYGCGAGWDQGGYHMGRLRLTVQRVSVRGCVYMDNDYSEGHWFDYQPPIEWVSSAEKFFVDGMLWCTCLHVRVCDGVPYATHTHTQASTYACTSLQMYCLCVCAHVNYCICYFLKYSLTKRHLIGYSSYTPFVSLMRKGHANMLGPG